MAKPIFNYSIYIRRVLKQVHPDGGINKNALSQINSLLNVWCDKLASKAVTLMHHHKQKTVSSRDIQSAVRLLLPGELAKHAVSEGTKAVTRFTSRGKGKRSAKAQLQFSVSRVEAQLRNHVCKGCRVGSGAPVYLTAVLEYLSAEVLELAVNAARDDHRTRITARNLYFAIANDEELNKLCKDRVFVAGGVMPNIHAALLPKKK